MLSRKMNLNQVYVLSALYNKDRYGLEIIETVKKESNVKLVLGSLYNVLNKLERDGLIEGYWGEQTLERGGNRRRYYKITGTGAKVLNEVQFGLNSLWSNLAF